MNYIVHYKKTKEKLPFSQMWTATSWLYDTSISVYNCENKKDNMVDNFMVPEYTCSTYFKASLRFIKKNNNF